MDIGSKGVKPVLICLNKTFEILKIIGGNFIYHDLHKTGHDLICIDPVNGMIRIFALFPDHVRHKR